MKHVVPARSTPLVSRRTALFGLGTGVLTALALRGRNALAQGATPAWNGAVGLTGQLLGSGMPASAPGLELTLRRRVLAPGGRLPDHTHPGALVTLVEAGTVAYTALGGTAQVTRAPVARGGAAEWHLYPDIPLPLTRVTVTSTPGLAEELPIGTEVHLGPGDWIFAEDPRSDIRNAGEDEVVLLVAGLTRVGEPFTTFMVDVDEATSAP